MSDTNTILGWALGAGIVALGGGILFGKIIDSHHPEKEGYAIAAAEGSEGGGGAAEVPIATLLAAADPAKGEAVFAKCKACHTVTPGGAAGVGPNIHAILGKGIASGSFAYSDALKGVGGKWDFESMNKWLASPKKFVAGNKMSFPGISKPEDRADLIAYLNTQGSNLPLPAAPAADAAAPAEGGVAVPVAGAAGDAEPAAVGTGTAAPGQ